MNKRTLLVLGNPAARYLRHLARLPDETHIVTGETIEIFAKAAPETDAVFITGAYRDVLADLWPSLTKLQWVHSMFAGLEGLLFPALIESNVTLTNSAGVYARSLGEFVIAGMLHFAKDLRRMVRQQEARTWQTFDVEELHGRVLGVVGYGAIGRAAAERARAFGVKIHALRRRPELGANDPLVDRSYGVNDLDVLLAESDYLLVAAPLTNETRGMIGAKQLALLKPGAVLINVGRGPVIDEPALIDVLQSGRIKGAVLDVFNEEPLPPDHAFYGMDNVLFSPHTADHTATWLDETMEFFIANYQRFLEGRPLVNIVDKTAGY